MGIFTIKFVEIVLIVYLFLNLGLFNPITGKNPVYTGQVYWVWEDASWIRDYPFTVFHQWHRVPRIYYSMWECSLWAGYVMFKDTSELLRCTLENVKPEPIPTGP